MFRCSSGSTPRFGSDDMLSSPDGSRRTYGMDNGSAPFDMGTGCAIFHSVSDRTLFNPESDSALLHSRTPSAARPPRPLQQQRSTAMDRGKRSPAMNIFDEMIVDDDPPLPKVVASYAGGVEPCTNFNSNIRLDMASFHPNSEDTEMSLTQANGGFADFDFGFNDPPRMLSPFDETKCVASAIPMGSPSQKKASGLRASSSSFSSDDGSLGERQYTPYPANPPGSSSIEETERGDREFEVKYPKAIQATNQMNAALGICYNMMPTLPFHYPDWQYDSNVLIDNLEYHRSIQYGSTLYLKNISFFDITPDNENGFRAKKLLCHFNAEDMVALRASFVDMSAYGSGTWSYIVIGAKQAEASEYCHKNVRCDLNYCRGGTPIITSRYVDPNIWSPIVNAMSTGCCRITYLVEDWCWPPQKVKPSP
ncbi:MAG: hypothetical protein M1840_007747 [Geoglossum simile]|nr:MAG: hypothetical protein M1840_007747 [Geoglossum simile]